MMTPGRTARMSTRLPSSGFCDQKLCIVVKAAGRFYSSRCHSFVKVGSLLVPHLTSEMLQINRGRGDEL